MISSEESQQLKSKDGTVNIRLGKDYESLSDRLSDGNFGVVLCAQNDLLRFWVIRGKDPQDIDAQIKLESKDVKPIKSDKLSSTRLALDGEPAQSLVYHNKDDADVCTRKVFVNHNGNSYVLVFSFFSIRSKKSGRTYEFMYR